MSISSKCRQLFNFLAQNPSFHEQEEEKKWIATIDERRQTLLSSPSYFSPEVLRTLQLRRASISRSLLQSKDALFQWNQAQELLKQWLLEMRHVQLADLIELNRVLTKTIVPGFRKRAIYTAMVTHIKDREIDSMMTMFYHYLSTTLVSKHILYSAFVCRYWILSIHPFLEANGRTSQLFADYFLLKNDYLPQAFSTKLEATLIGEPEKKPYMTAHEGFRKFCQTIINAYKILAPGINEPLSRIVHHDQTTHTCKQ